MNVSESTNEALPGGAEGSKNEKRREPRIEPTKESRQAQSDRALAFVSLVLKHLEADAEASLAPGDEDETDDEIRIEIEGPDAGRVIGKRGAVLDAIQYLTTRIAARAGEGKQHILVDAEGYRARHEEQLGQMAQKLGERVAKEGKVITFDPMNPRDRRIVHMALKDVPGVRTESNGQGQDRRVQIIPDPNKVVGAESESDEQD
jgi:spoIIIJ-associated protein